MTSKYRDGRSRVSGGKYVLAPVVVMMPLPVYEDEPMTDAEYGAWAAEWLRQEVTRRMDFEQAVQMLRDGLSFTSIVDRFPVSHLEAKA